MLYPVRPISPVATSQSGNGTQAINELVDGNVLIRHQGKGTFVASYTADRRVFHFFRIFFRINSDEGGMEYPEGELIACRRINPTAPSQG